jgi:hypothetical protein
MEAVERMVIERECERLIVAYTHLVDFGEAAKVAELFTGDGSWEGPNGASRGRDEVARAFANRQKMSSYRTSRHVCSNVAISVTGPDTAEGTCYLVLYRHDKERGNPSAPPPTAGPPNLVGQYRDWFARTDEGWRFRRRVFEVVFHPGAGA